MWKREVSKTQSASQEPLGAFASPRFLLQLPVLPGSFPMLSGSY